LTGTRKGDCRMDEEMKNSEEIPNTAEEVGTPKISEALKKALLENRRKAEERTKQRKADEIAWRNTPGFWDITYSA